MRRSLSASQHCIPAAVITTGFGAPTTRCAPSCIRRCRCPFAVGPVVQPVECWGTLVTQIAMISTSTTPLLQQHQQGRRPQHHRDGNGDSNSRGSRNHQNSNKPQRNHQQQGQRSNTHQRHNHHHQNRANHSHHNTSTKPTQYQEHLASHVTATGEAPVTPLTLDEKLQRRFGPHAKLVVRQQQRPVVAATAAAGQNEPQRDGGDLGANNTTHSTSPGPAAVVTVFKASVTFKQLGFPVEIASVEADTFNEAEALAFRTAMDSNVIALTPNMFRTNQSSRHEDASSSGGEGDVMVELRELKRTVDDLRNACQTLGRVLKFSVKPKVYKPKQKAETPTAPNSSDSNENITCDAPADAAAPSPPAAPPATITPPTFGCRVYFRDDWSVTANLAFLHEARGYSPNDALTRCLRDVGQRFADDLKSDAFVKADYLEAVRVLDLHGKSVVTNVVANGESSGAERKSLTNDDSTAATPDVPHPSSNIDGTTFSITTRVTDHATGNTYEVRCNEQESLVDAYHNIAMQLFKAEANTIVVQHNLTRVDDNNDAEKVALPLSVGTNDATGSFHVLAYKRDAAAAAAEWMSGRSSLAAGRTVGGNVFTLADQAESMPLMLKLRYQCEGMIYHALESQLIIPTSVVMDDASSTPSPFQIATIAKRIMQVSVEEVMPAGSLTTVVAADGSAAERIVSTRAYLFRATATLNGATIGTSEGHGPYRVELDVWIQLLSHLLDTFPEVARFHFAHCYPTIEALERAAHHHDHYRLFNLKGKWSVYSVLGAIASTLLTPDSVAAPGVASSAGGHQRFDKELLDFDGTNTSCRAEAKIIVNDGYQSRKMIAKRFGPQRGHAVRSAVLDAIQHNFPNQYQIACQHDDFGVMDSDDISAHGRRLRALPREKRVTHVNQLFGVIGCFAEEDYGWRALRIRTRTIAGDANRCIAELEAQVQGERGRRIVAASPIAATAKNAKKLLIYQVCKQYFPKDLENYNKLGRGDSRHPEALSADHSICRVYSAAVPFFAQVLAMLDKRQPELAPFTWRLERVRKTGAHDDDDGSEESLLQPLHLRFKAAVLGNNGDVVVAERLGDEGEGAMSVVRSVLRATCTTYTKEVGALDSIELWREFETSPPPPVSSSHDLCSVLFQLSLGGLGGGDGSSRDATNTQQQLVAQGRPAVEVLCTKVNVGDWWLATVVLPNMNHLSIARAAGRTKREAHRGALMLAARTCFAKQLRYFSKNFVEVHAFTDEIFHERVALTPQVDGSGHLLRQPQAIVTSPKQFLEKCLSSKEGKHRLLVVRYEQQCGGSTWECRLYAQTAQVIAASPSDNSANGGEVTQRGDVEEEQIGFGTGLSKAQALHDACGAALETHYSDQLNTRRIVDPTFLTEPFVAASSSAVELDGSPESYCFGQEGEKEC